MGQARLPRAISIGLSNLELCCLQLYALGFTRAEIASRENVAVRTVGSSLTIAKEKLGARSLAHAVLILSQTTDAPYPFVMSHSSDTAAAAKA